MSEIKVLLADDHAIVMEGLEVILSSDEQVQVVGTAANGEEVLAFVAANEVDMVILDINMPVMDGITCARKLKKKYPALKIIILTMFAQKSFVDEILKIGIDGCLLKNNTGKELIGAINRVMSGQPYYDRLREFKSDEEIKQHKLSAREIDVIRLMAEGLTSTEIGEKLFISDLTVQTHRRNLMRKLDMNKGVQVVQYAKENGLI
ncbi:two component transcriptional regulator, LuxR family [Reichenbachiella agariperforans]|uniref:Two component transcriptional regulator, LuxR family n=1 Tax=Reichenbachiella agariperforans TaxID=156994 RepID=A0A1M6NHH8_REIAG|nr:response regulator transcription factor [Reichenbachiella agariperforans]SHJ95083.1 two component transcriptional regulator, LuxR family [Reichenbachiella agariperforans]